MIIIPGAGSKKVSIKRSVGDYYALGVALDAYTVEIVGQPVLGGTAGDLLATDPGSTSTGNVIVKFPQGETNVGVVYKLWNIVLNSWGTGGDRVYTLGFTGGVLPPHNPIIASGSGVSFPAGVFAGGKTYILSGALTGAAPGDGQVIINSPSYVAGDINVFATNMVLGTIKAGLGMTFAVSGVGTVTMQVPALLKNLTPIKFGSVVSVTFVDLSI